MKVSAFTFIRNGQQLGFPFIQSIQSILPICDEFIVNVGDSQDDTMQMLLGLNEKKIKILQTPWNNHMQTKGYVYAQQKMIAQFSCTGDWAFYLEGDEIVHEADLPKIYAAMQQHLEDTRVESLAFRYKHFYGNMNTYVWSPAFYRIAPRIIKTSVRSYAPDGLYWLVLRKNNRKAFYPTAKLIEDVEMYHYGWVRAEDQMTEKFKQVDHLWSQVNLAKNIQYAQIDAKTLQLFEGTHPAIIEGFFPKAEGLFAADPNHRLSKRERKHRVSLLLERWLGLDLCRKHCKLI